jgi:hypothetical protein
MKPLTHADVAAFLQYDESAKPSCLRWLAKPNRRIRVGSVAGFAANAGYIGVQVNGLQTYAHRVVWLLMTGNWPADQIDHIDGNKSNNTINNLRQATGFENQQNHRKERARSKSRLLGVHWNETRRTWFARIQVKGKSRYLGVFASPHDAYAAYISAKRELHTFGQL